MTLTFPTPVQENVLLSGLTTLGVGGPARYLARPRNASEAGRLLAFCQEQDLAVTILGQGSNLLVSDAGFDGLVLSYQDQGLAQVSSSRLRVGAGTCWDDLVEYAVSRGLAGVECLSGIPGLAGAAPIQNIGAYGQEVAEVLAAVEVLDRQTGEPNTLARETCGFGYRSSHFKHGWAGRYLVTGIELELRPGGEATVRYGDLRRRLEAATSAPGLAEVRKLVLEVRRSKSMVVDPQDPNSRSAGSFFVNPVVPEAVAGRLGEAGEEMPRYPAEGGVKLSAAWLIERAGFSRGYAHGRAGLSKNHVLALINRGGATARELVELAAQVRGTVRRKFGIELVPEPNFLGFAKPAVELLDELDPG